MAKVATPVDTQYLQQIISEEENKAEHSGMMQFFEHCAEIYNRTTTGKNITASIIYLRNRDGLVTTKIKGSRGRQKGFVLSDDQKQKMVQGRKNAQKRELSEESKELLRSNFPTHAKLVERVLQGSMSAAIKLKCLDCCCQDRESIRECTSLDCSLYQFRPYQKRIPQED